MTDVLGSAIADYYHKCQAGLLWINNRYGPPEEMPVETFFRTESEMPELEHIALRQCRGSILDIGAGAGSHSLLLQQKGLDVTALEISPKAAAVIKQRGVNQVVANDVWQYKEQRYDTLLLLMNGIGFTGTLQNLEAFLKYARNLLNPGGKLIFDSSDIAYLYDEGSVTRPKGYYGELWYRYEYNRQKTEWFKWLYADQQVLTKIAENQGYKVSLLYQDDYDQYLVKLS
jgi:SAM-dependent methyltransferase